MNVRWEEKKVSFQKEGERGDEGKKEEIFVQIPSHLASGFDAGDWLGWGSAELAGFFSYFFPNDTLIEFLVHQKRFSSMSERRNPENSLVLLLCT